MAFSLRKMLSNITYFKKPGEDVFDHSEASSSTFVEPEEGKNVNFECAEPDSTSTLCSTSLKVPESVRNFAAKKGSLSDTDLLNLNIEAPTKRSKRKNKKLKLDVSKGSQSLSESIDKSDSNVENTPTHVLLDSKSAELGQHFKGFDFNSSFDIFDAMSDASICEEDNVDIESLSDESETDISLDSDISNDVQMCRKVDAITVVPDLLPSPSPESFGDVELEKNEQERVSMLLDYQMQLEKLDTVLKKLLTDFKFHIEVSKVFNYHSVASNLSDKDVIKEPKMLEGLNLDKLNQGLSRTGSWNFILENPDDDTKINLKKQLLNMKNTIEDFVQVHFEKEHIGKCRKLSFRNHRSLTYDVNKSKHKKLNYCTKKRYKHFDFPDIRDAMINLFEPDFHTSFPNNTNHILNDFEESDETKCVCRCQLHGSSSTPNDSGLNTKNDVSSQSITSSIGNFSLDTSTLTAYSESLDLIVSYSSFQDTSLYSTLLQKPAIERITFYVQVHSIQLKCEATDQEYESKNIITFYCPSCKSTENEENSLLKHILSKLHCEKIHFVYKTAYIKKCVASGKEIMPSTVLNPMTMYRDDNKIVCFGDAMYACSLCFENLIAGESILMAHCSEAEHIERREKLSDMLD